MSILSIQKQARRLGKIRLGTKGPKGNPIKLKTFRLTSPAEGLIKQAAEQYGGTVEPWGTQYEVITEQSELPVVIPPQDPDNISWYELWSRGGLQRRCNVQDIVSEAKLTPCVCDPDERECSPHTRVQFMLPDLEDIGVWMLESTGYYAATELGMAVDLVMRQSRTTGWLPEAVLAIEEREVKRVGEARKDFIVPVLRLPHKLSDLLGASPQAASLTAGRSESGEREAPSPPLPAPLPQEVSGTGYARQGGEDGIEWAEATAEIQVEDLPFVEDPGMEEVWQGLYETLDVNPFDGTNPVIEENTRTLYRLMATVGLWPDDGLHLAIAKYCSRHGLEHKRPGEVHYSDLGVKATMSAFLDMSLKAARKRVDESNQEDDSE